MGKHFNSYHAFEIELKPVRSVIFDPVISIQTRCRNLTRHGIDVQPVLPNHPALIQSKSSILNQFLAD